MQSAAGSPSTSDKHPRLSVVIPTCGRTELLRCCLDSLAPGIQSLDADQYEVIVSDDGEASDTRALLAESYPWAKWVEGPRRGPAANRNRGAKAARADILVFTDDDCLPDSNWLESLDASFRAGHLVVEGKTVTDSPARGPLFEAPANETGGFLWSCNLGIVRRVFEELGGFDCSFPHPHMEDVDLRRRLTQRGYKFDFVEDAVVVHPQRPLKPILKHVLTYESYFYFSRKHQIPLSECGFHLGLIRFRLKQILRCSDLPDLLRLLERTVIETLLVVPMCLVWSRRYRHSSTQAEGSGVST